MSTFLRPINEFEKQGIENIRQLFGDQLPKDIDTDFNLRRWVDGWKGDMKQIEPRLRVYIENRKVLKLDDPNLLDRPMDSIMSKAFKHLSVSVRQPPLINPIDNTLSLVYRLENVDLIGLAKMFTPSDYLYFNFVMSEVALRHILRQEAESGKESGLSMLYDMHGIHLSDFINPSSPLMKMMQLGMQLQQDYFCNIMHQIVCVRVPNFMNILWEVAKKFVNETTQKKFVMYTEHKYRQHLFEHIDPSAVPVFYGGQWREDPFADLGPHLRVKVDEEICASIPELVSESDHFAPSWTPDEWIVHYIKPKQTFTTIKSIGDNQNAKTLKWQFETNSNVEFALYFEKTPGGHRKLIQAKLVLCTPFGPEAKHVLVDDYGSGDYIFEFANHSTTWFSLKLQYCIQTEKE